MNALRCLALYTAAAWVACSSSGPTSPEAALRKRLGVPAEAKTVIVFAQTAHLDIDWQATFDAYYAAYVGDIFLEARAILEGTPRAAFSIAELAYLQHHVETHPEELPRLRALAQSGALRLVGGGFTSPDTMLPETELLLRDFLHGARYADATFGVRPIAAWLPDSFGHGASAPDVLAAAGLGSVAFSRIDGAPAFYEQLHGQGIRPGSSAAFLAAEGSADFRWRGTGGAEVLGHFLSKALYCTGDDIDYAEPITLPGLHLGTYHGDDPAYTDGKIDEYAAALRPWGKTPYRFVPVGCDFQHPKPKLTEYLAGYNERRYPTTGVWAVAATFEEYAELVGFHRDALPVIEGELGPYYLGFYATRPEVKRRVREAAAPFFVAEAERAAQAFNRPLEPFVLPPEIGMADANSALPGEGTLFTFSGDGVVTAWKPAADGDGLVARALVFSGALTLTPSAVFALTRATRTDAAERPLEALGAASSVVLDRGRAGSIATVRLRR